MAAIALDAHRISQELRGALDPPRGHPPELARLVRALVPDQGKGSLPGREALHLDDLAVAERENERANTARGIELGAGRAQREVGAAQL